MVGAPSPGTQPSFLQCTCQLPAAKNYLVQNVTRAEVEKLSIRLHLYVDCRQEKQFFEPKYLTKNTSKVNK